MRNPMTFRGAREGCEARKRVSDIDLHALSSRYGRVFAGCTLVVPGANRTYRLNAGDNAYYLRLYRPFGRSKVEIAFEMCLLREFRPMPGIDVARPIPTVDGAHCAHVLFDGADHVAGLFTPSTVGRSPTTRKTWRCSARRWRGCTGLYPGSRPAVRVRSIQQGCAPTPLRRWRALPAATPCGTP